MSHLSDKELDRLSREAAEQFDVEGSTSGWDALEKKLDSAMPADAPLKRRRGLWYWLTGSLLLIGLLGYYFFSDNGINSSNVSMSKSASQDKSASQESSASQGSSKSASNSKSAGSSEFAGSSESPIASTEKLLSEQKNPVLKSPENSISDNKRIQEATLSQPGKRETDSENSAETIISIKGSKINSDSKDQPSGTNLKTVSKNRGNKQVLSDLNESKNKLAKSSVYQNPINIGGSISTNNDGSISTSSPDAETVSEDSETDFIKQTFLPEIDRQYNAININKSTHADSMIADLANAAIPERDTSIKSTTIFPIEVGMLLGSDMSNVNFQGNDRVGLNFGISVGYRFNKRWQINSGLIHTKKFYQARGKDFHPPKGYWTDYVKLDLVAGNCSMWEIPLNIRYDLSLARKGSWFISGGLSTYLMQQEDYDYHYWSNGDFYTRHKGYPSDEKSILGILNLSGGFEKNFTPHVSLQIEPYLHIPLKGVGFGNLQMNSFGTNFILKFKSGPAKK
jgi:hypothetical protein